MRSECIDHVRLRQPPDLYDNLARGSSVYFFLM